MMSANQAQMIPSVVGRVSRFTMPCAVEHTHSVCFLPATHSHRRFVPFKNASPPENVSSENARPEEVSPENSRPENARPENALQRFVCISRNL